MPLTLQGKAISTARRLHAIPDITSVIPITLTSGGVTLFLSRETGEFWIDVEIEHDSFALAVILECSKAYGFVLDDPEYDEQQATGRLRSYLLEVETD